MSSRKDRAKERANKERARESLSAFAEAIETKLPPKGLGVFYAGKRVGKQGHLRMLGETRRRTYGLHEWENRPPRRERMIEYIAAPERGERPLRSSTGRWHLHVLLFNLHNISLDKIARVWCEVSGLKDSSELWLEPFVAGIGGAEYWLKTLHSGSDDIIFSDGFVDFVHRKLGPLGFSVPDIPPTPQVRSAGCANDQRELLTGEEIQALQSPRHRPVAEPIRTRPKKWRKPKFHH